MRRRAIKSALIFMIIAMVFTMMPLTASAASKNPGKTKITSYKVGKVSSSTSLTTVTIKWKKASKATGYEVWEKHGTNDWRKLKKVGRSKKGLRIKNVPTGQYSLRVRAIRKAKGKIYYGKFSAVKSKFISSPMSLEQLANKYPALKNSGDPAVSLTYSGNTAIYTMDILTINPGWARKTKAEVLSLANNLLGLPEMINAASQYRSEVNSKTGVSNARIRIVFNYKGVYLTSRDY